MRSAPLYRGLTLLYPREFRNRYRNDLIQYHADLTRDRGRAAAWPSTVSNGMFVYSTSSARKLNTVFELVAPAG